MLQFKGNPEPVEVTVALPTGSNTIGKVHITDGTEDLNITAAGEAEVSLTTELPAGTQNIGDVDVATIAAGDNNIGNVDVLSVIPGVGATNLGKAEDAVHASGDVGVMPLSVRTDTLAAGAADGDYQALVTDLLSRLHVMPGDPMLEIPRGNITGISPINKFGRAIDGGQVTLTDVWDRADATPTQQIWIAPTAARIHAILSTSDEDSDTGGTVAQGDGARTIRVYGLTGWGTAEVSEDIVMDGTATGANEYKTVNSYVIIHRMKVLTKGSNVAGPNVGTITATAATDGTVTAQIVAMEGQTQMAIYGIPSTQTMYLTKYYSSAHEAGQGVNPLVMDTILKVNPEPDVERINFITKHTNGSVSTGTGVIEHTFLPYYKIAGPAIIKIQVLCSIADSDVSAGFDGIIVTT